MVWSSRDFPGRDGDGQPLCSLDCPRIRSRSSGLAHKMIVTSPRTRTQLMSACYREPSTQTYKGFSASELISNCKFTRQIPIPRYRVHWSAVFMLASIAKGIHHTRIFLELSVYAREGNWLRNYCWGWVQGIVRCGNLVTTGRSISLSFIYSGSLAFKLLLDSPQIFGLYNLLESNLLLALQTNSFSTHIYRCLHIVLTGTQSSTLRLYPSFLSIRDCLPSPLLISD